MDNALLKIADSDYLCHFLKRRLPDIFEVLEETCLFLSGEVGRDLLDGASVEGTLSDPLFSEPLPAGDILDRGCDNFLFSLSSSAILLAIS